MHNIKKNTVKKRTRLAIVAALALCAVAFLSVVAATKVSANDIGQWVQSASGITVADDKVLVDGKEVTGPTAQEIAKGKPNTSSKADAERYRDCLRGQGLPAVIQDDNNVVFEGGMSEGKEIPGGGMSAGMSSDGEGAEMQRAIDSCKVQVPGYREPDLNIR